MKSYQARSREVREQSRSLMQRLREERASKSRHVPRAAPAIESAVSVSPQKPAEESAIIASRSIRAAAAPAGPANDARNDIVPPTPAKAKAAKRKPRQKAAPAAVDTAPCAAPELLDSALAPAAETSFAPQAPIVARAPRKPKAAKQASVPKEAAMPARDVDAPQMDVPAIEAAADPAAAPETPTPSIQRAPAKPRKMRAHASVAAIIADGLEPVNALQQAVAAAMGAQIAPSPDLAMQGFRGGQPVTAVPSLGPGMVWRLNQLGIRTLGELAACDAEDLRTRLGKLGRMVNVDQWISFARTG
jgi:predicted flap endonuclease-1-like 5' DNA nuclease